MKKLNQSLWPVLIISNDLNQKSDSEEWIEEVIQKLEDSENCSALMTSSSNDVYDILSTGVGLGAIIVENDLVLEELNNNNQLGLSLFEPEMSLTKNLTDSESMLNMIRVHDKDVPVLLMAPRCSIEDIPYEVLEHINGIIWKFSDPPEALAGNIAEYINIYSGTESLKSDEQKII